MRWHRASKRACMREALREDQKDLAAFAERVGEPSVGYEEFLAQLKVDGTL